jgi:hypothetical protein
VLAYFRAKSKSPARRFAPCAPFFKGGNGWISATRDLRTGDEKHEGRSRGLRFKALNPIRGNDFRQSRAEVRAIKKPALRRAFEVAGSPPSRG